MTGAEEELQELRRRAYGPAADIHLDTHALERLRRLEATTRPQPPTERSSEPDLAREHHRPADLPVEPNDDGEGHGDTRSRQFRLRARLVLRWLRRIRRSTLLIALGLVVTASVLIVAVVVAQRVQTDPLLVGAAQAARLSADSSFTAPAIFNRGESVHGFQEFHGLRVIVGDGELFAGAEGDDCLTVVSAADLANATSNSFSGFAMTGCAAGSFPAIVQFRVDREGAPAELSTAFPGSAALQFVYDRDHDEVVVFAMK